MWPAWAGSVAAGVGPGKRSLGGDGGAKRAGGGAIRTERVCRLVLPSVSTCSPFEEGILRLRMGGG